MRRALRILAAAICAAALSSAASGAEESKVHVFVDVSYAPEAGDTALKSTALVMEWYPKINEILFGADHPLPFDVVTISFVPDLEGPAATSGNTIRVSSKTIKVMKDDWRAMVIHELTHVVQNYPSGNIQAGWLVEGIADYVRHKCFEKDIRDTLRLTSAGVLTGYSLAQPFNHRLELEGVNLNEQGYLKSYTVASTFLFWLESHKDKDIVRKLNLAMNKGEYVPDLFAQNLGKPLDDLWAEFVIASKPH